MSVVVVVCGLWFTFHFFFLFAPNLVVQVQTTREGLGMRRLIHLFVVISIPPNLILFVTHHHTWTLSLSLSLIMKIKWMVRAFMGRGCFPGERDRESCPLVQLFGCVFHLPFFTLSDCPSTTEFNFGLTLMLNYLEIYDLTLPHWPQSTHLLSLYPYIYSKLSMMLQKNK